VSAPSSALARLHDLVSSHRLTPVQRRIVQAIANHLDVADSLSSAELASLAGVSQPSVVRLARTLGFSSFQAMRRALRELVREPDLEEPPGIRAIRQEIANLTWLEHALGRSTTLADAAALATASVPLVVVGVRASAPLAEYLAFYARKVHPHVTAITRADSAATDALEEARVQGATAAIILALPRWPRELLHLVDHASSLGLRLVSIADREHGPISDRAHVRLVAPVGTDLLYDTHATAFVLAQLLVQAIADADPERSRAAMEAFETRAQRAHYFLRGEQ